MKATMVGRRILLCAMVSTALSGAAASQAKYDVNLERAAMKMIAGKIGDIRPSLDLRQEPPVEPEIVEESPPSTASPTASWRFLEPERQGDVKISGSVQIFSDGSPPQKKDRNSKAARTVSRILRP